MALPDRSRAEPARRDTPEKGDALIGYTGFVGGNLMRQRRFGSLYNSANIEDIRGRAFDTLVCAGVTAEKWRANREPAADFASIDRLWASLREADTRKLILISTVDVYPAPVAVDETTPIYSQLSLPYGRHRYELEVRARDHFDTLVIRLPGLFGRGLKKNALFDLLHAHETDRLDSRGVFQFYEVERLTRDMDKASVNGLSLLNVATEPLSLEEISRDCFGAAFVNHIVERPASYDMRSIHAALFGGSSGYLLTRREVKESLRRWVESERRNRA